MKINTHALRYFFRKFGIWFVLALIILISVITVSKRRSHNYISYDSAVIAKGKIDQPLLIDTLQISLSDRKVSDFIKTAALRPIIQKKIKSFYELNALKAKWLGDKAPTKEYYGLVKLIKSGENHGLSSDLYNLTDTEEKLRELYQEDEYESLMEVELEITERFFLYSTHLRQGRISPHSNNKAVWKHEVKSNYDDDIKILLDAKGDDLTYLNKKLQPQSKQYEALVNAYQHYNNFKNEDIAESRIKINKKIKLKQRHEAIPLIRKRLSIINEREYPIREDSITKQPDSLLYDDDLQEGIKKFQNLHGLEPTGIIGGITVKFLNRTMTHRARIIALNMERERWRSGRTDRQYVEINIPEYMLRVVEDEDEKLKMKVVVGAPEKPTPVFNDALEYIIFSPTWNVPVSIIEEEIIPRIQEDPDYYSERNYTFYRNKSEIDPLDENWDDELNPHELTIVQQPGADNALGLVKFVMPNSMSIYLHDTPQQRLFKKYWRAFSHGCVRLNEPQKFAAYLLRDKSSWTDKKITEAMNKGEPETVKLSRPLPVHFEYRTCWVDDSGQLNFRDDIYGHDAIQLKELAALESKRT